MSRTVGRFTLDNFYQSDTWRKFRRVVMDERTNDNGDIICERCGKPIVHEYDCIAHHITELTDDNVNDVAVALNPDNIALLHHKCHNKCHNKLGYSLRRVYLVYGSPMSGKSSWVRESAGEGDLIVDMDSIWQCVSGCDRYVKPRRLNAVAFGVRDALLDMVKYRKGRWLNAYVIGGYPFAGERERLAKELGAQEIFIDTSYDECVRRLQCCEDGRDKTEWGSYISEWWNKYSPPGSVSN